MMHDKPLTMDQVNLLLTLAWPGDKASVGPEQPWEITVRGRRHVVATDNRRMLLLASESFSGYPPPASILDFVADLPIRGCRIDRDELTATIARSVERDRPCCIGPHFVDSCLLRNTFEHLPGEIRMAVDYLHNDAGTNYVAMVFRSDDWILVVKTPQ